MIPRSLLACTALVATSALATPAIAAPTLEQAIHAPIRTPKLVARDSARHPAQELAFFGLKPTANVVEIWPGSGYWTQILAPYLHAHGTYTLALNPHEATADPDGTITLKPALKQMMAEHPECYDHVKTALFDAHHLDFAPPNSVDLILTFRNMHNWMEAGNTPDMLAAIHKALKTGGILGIEDHRGNTTAPQDPKAENGYIRQAYAIDMVEKAGFKLIGTSEMDANPKDTANWPKGVWTLPPTYALGETDHAKYQAIGEGDNFVLKFRKTNP